MVVIPQLARVGNVAFEGFSTLELAAAKVASLECKRGGQLAADTVQAATIDGLLGPSRMRLQTWFGITAGKPRHDVFYATLRENLLAVNRTLVMSPLTVAYRPDIVLKHAPHDRKLPKTDMLLGDGSLFSGAGVYGYVHQHQAGSGYRVICGRPFIMDSTPHYASTTLYHELTHKVFKSKDHCYGEELCRALARSNPEQAMDNADNYAYFVISLFSKKFS